MWHIDEGALHAYLDGALDEYPAAEARRVREHLDACAECADRLAAERRTRERADEILALAAPRVEAPSFEDLRAYVRRNQPVTTRVSVRLYRMGWAASVALALGTGWMLRGGALDPVLSPGSGSALTSGDSRGIGAEATADLAEADMPPGEAEALRQEREAVRSESARVEANELLSQSAEPSSATAQPTPAPTAGAATLADAATPNDPVPARSLDVVANATAPSDARADFILPAPSAPPTPVAGAGAAPSAIGASAARERAAGGVGSDADAQKVVETQVASGPQASPGDTDAARRAAPEQRITSALIAEPALAGALTRSAPGSVQAERVADDDAVSLVVPGLEVLDVLPVGEGTTFAGMRALQRLQSGDTLELMHLPGTVSTASLPPLRVGWSELVRERGEGWLVMRAPVPEATLAELLLRLEAGR
ncbi:MAG: hypothetical protein WEB90_02335 [Gemmatimonadota bacterium]